MASGWTDQPLAVGQQSPAPLVLDAEADWQALVGRFADVAMYEFAAGLGQPPDLTRLRTVVGERREVCLWPLRPGPVGSAPLAVYSIHTTVPRVAAVGLEVDDPTWKAAIAALCAAVFAHEAEAKLVTVHLPVDADEACEGALFALGFSPYAIDPHYKPPVVRQIYGLRREVFERFRRR